MTQNNENTMMTINLDWVKDILRSGRVPNTNDMDLWQHLDAARQNLEEAVQLANTHLKKSSLTKIVSDHAMIGSHQPEGTMPTIQVMDNGEVVLTLTDKKRGRKASTDKSTDKVLAQMEKKTAKKAVSKTAAKTAAKTAKKAVSKADDGKRAYTSSLPKLAALRERAVLLGVDITKYGRARGTIIKVLDDVEAKASAFDPTAIPMKEKKVKISAKEVAPVEVEVEVAPVILDEDAASTTTLVSPGVKRKRMKKGDAVQVTAFPPETDLGDLFNPEAEAKIAETARTNGGDNPAKTNKKVSVADMAKGAGDLDLDKLLNL